MSELANNLDQSSEDFSRALISFQKSLDQERNFYQILPTID
jgi:hypothetical protein